MSLDETVNSADLGGSSKYSNEKSVHKIALNFTLKTEVEKGFM